MVRVLGPGAVLDTRTMTRATTAALEQLGKGRKQLEQGRKQLEQGGKQLGQGGKQLEQGGKQLRGNQKETEYRNLRHEYCFGPIVLETERAWSTKVHQRLQIIELLVPASQHSSLERNYTDKELINDMIVPLLHQWTKANALFKPPVINQCRTIELKLTKLWHKAVETSLGKGNLARKNEFLHTLDTLFDILTCKCSIQLCSESNCSHSGKRENNSHIDCGCPREKKIPVLELEFIKAQRTKAEGQGSMQMGSIDYSETKKQIANAKKREQIREREQKKKMKSEEAIQREEELCQDVYHFFDIPPINVNATKLSELVDLSLEVLEPPLTTSLTSQELRNLKETPMQVPKWPSHTQSVERCVKMVTKAAGHVYSHERR
ncbi:hypothetical protein Hamer_G031489, partial [Homarus americanus]